MHPASLETNPGKRHAIQLRTGDTMKLRSLHVIVLSALTVAMIACGAGHPTISSIVVTPSTATSPVDPHTDVQYTATATFSNSSSRELTVADGLTWASSNTSIATISDSGSATCVAIGQVTITATAPSDLNITVNNGVQNTSPKVSGTAQLNCVVHP
jgi:hypothetical protein